MFPRAVPAAGVSLSASNVAATVDETTGRILEVVFHRYPEKTVLLLFYSCRLIRGEPQPLDVEELAWVGRNELADLDWVPADVAFIRKLTDLM